MLCSTLIVAVVAAGGSPAEKPPRDANAVRELVERAVVNGLTEDGVRRDLAAALAANKTDYVGKCVLCDSVRAGLTAYARLPARPTGAGLSAAATRRLTSADPAVRRAALRDLAADYVEREYGRRQLPAAERAAMDATFGFHRKLMAPALPKGQEFCPSCDGVCRVRPRQAS